MCIGAWCSMIVWLIIYVPILADINYKWYRYKRMDDGVGQTAQLIFIKGVFDGIVYFKDLMFAV